MNFSIFIRSCPHTSPGSKSAILFTKALFINHSSHSIDRVFFYLDAVQHANIYTIIPTDEIDLSQEWSHLSSKYNFSLHVCSTSAERYGIIKNKNLNKNFILSGLGQLSDAILTSDKVIEF
ncbi:MAG: tRNA 2-thiouridine synthesizing protein D [Francisellaceae bacterium]|jgi:tRNA 2-thiouridine synthesizing protein D